MNFKLGDIVFHKKENLGVGSVKDTNGVNKVLVEFGTIDKDNYIRDWFSMEDIELAKCYK